MVGIITVEYPSTTQIIEQLAVDNDVNSLIIWLQFGIKLAQTFAANSVPSVSAVNLCLSGKACVTKQQIGSKLCVALFEDKLAPNW
ncbi:hypothetical protein G5I_01181 [Acromyrmex echinatior]|uniref:Uncharacterized protein n=1 Tax=Acromyrmex echinatior TaxID=103372 RepID=F4W6X4_ACREC|nr:hypothetical protein G5I_01181 [Acromyrmex echinatior]